ncbi:MetQ/NlpA family ABC transporter substrate-binding protein [uncultured Brachyspira sp.]|uniref:MetQ/NlpA family ABC transporter substrate-binding protein n=1 Tax=uncultured Brachyspira sp. TaxID=221953 RepID=UPI0025E7D07B|nr:MetQ/NlpA family ABC transporter substrate-binding protein [uncultured Brachyspira sp.]
MKRILFIFTLMLAVLSCSNNSQKNIVVKIGHVGESDRMIWKPVIEKLAKENIKVELVSFSDYTIPNQALNDGEIDLNAFQHHAYLNNEVQNKKYDITAIADTYISTMNIYSDNIADVKELKNGDKIAIPNDPANGGRALKVLEAAGIIKVKPESEDSPSISDIIENSLNIELIEVDAGSIYSLLPDVACAVINCNYAIDFGLNPKADAIFKDNPSIYSGKSFINLIAARTEDKDNELYKKIVSSYQSADVEKVYNEDFKGAYLPAWK